MHNTPAMDSDAAPFALCTCQHDGQTRICIRAGGVVYRAVVTVDATGSTSVVLAEYSGPATSVCPVPPTMLITDISSLGLPAADTAFAQMVAYAGHAAPTALSNANPTN